MAKKKSSDLVEAYGKVRTKKSVVRVLAELKLDPKEASAYVKCTCPNCENTKTTGFIYPEKGDLIWCKNCGKSASLISLITGAPHPQMSVWRKGLSWFCEIAKVDSPIHESFPSYWNEQDSLGEEE